MAVLLAVYGWRLLTRLAKCREAYDLSCSIIGSLEDLREQSRASWQEADDFLHEYHEHLILAKLSNVEIRLNLMALHYHSSPVSTQTLIDLKRMTTMPEDLLGEVIETFGSRETAVSSTIMEIINDVLGANYQYINDNRKLRPF